MDPYEQGYEDDDELLCPHCEGVLERPFYQSCPHCECEIEAKDWGIPEDVIAMVPAPYPSEWMGLFNQALGHIEETERLVNQMG